MEEDGGSGTSPPDTTSAAPRARKRARRACDQCRSSRARCSGARPCGRCRDYGWACTDVAVLKKRGRPSKHAPTSIRDDMSEDGSTDIAEDRPSLGRSVSDFATSHPHLEVQSEPVAAAAEAWLHTQQRTSTTPASPETSKLSNGRQGEIPGGQHVWQDDSLQIPTAGYPQDIASSLPVAAHSGCRYPFLNPALPFLTGVMPITMAHDLLETVLTDPGVSVFKSSVPFIPTRIFRRDSIINPVRPRVTSPALIVAMLWCAANSAELPALQRPGARATLLSALQRLTISLSQSRTNESTLQENGTTDTRNNRGSTLSETGISHASATRERPTLSSIVDDVLTYTLIAIVVSGGEFRGDLHKWWSKAILLSHDANLHRLDANDTFTDPQGVPGSSGRWSHTNDEVTLEEARRVFWLLFALDRHLALSSNTALTITDSDCSVYAPLPERLWEAFDISKIQQSRLRVLGPPLKVHGTTFFEYFLPLMAILGDIILVHRMQDHPRLCSLVSDEHIGDIANSIKSCRDSVEHLLDLESTRQFAPDSGLAESAGSETQASVASQRYQYEITAAYSIYILDVLAVLLYGRWDPISMLDDTDNWIASDRFQRCSNHSISASSTVSHILALDPELKFMPYLFGIYLLHGSFVLLLFADRMPQLGLNSGVEQACETLIRAHEVCAATLNTEYQINFRRVLRYTMYRVRGSDASDFDYQKARSVLSLLRWIPGSRGLALQS